MSRERDKKRNVKELTYKIMGADKNKLYRSGRQAGDPGIS